MLIQDYRNQLKEAIESIPDKDIIKCFVLIYEKWKDNKNIFICGNGGSASTASHFATDLTKLGLNAYSLDDNLSTITMIANDSGWDKVYIEQLNNRFQGGDLLICISVHGGVGSDKATPWSQNLLQAIDYAKAISGRVMGIVGDTGGIVKDKSDAYIWVKNNLTSVIESTHNSITHLLVELLKQCHPVKICRNCLRIRNSNITYCICNEVEFEYAIGFVGNIEDWKKLI